LRHTHLIDFGEDFDALLRQAREIAPVYPGPVYIDFLPLIEDREPPYPLYAVATWKREGALLLCSKPVHDDREVRDALRECWTKKAQVHGLNLSRGVIDTRCWPLSAVPESWTTESRRPEASPVDAPDEPQDEGEIPAEDECDGLIWLPRGEHMADDVLVVLQQAIVKEQERQAFYEDAAQRTCNPLAQKTFAALGQWEADHKQYIQAYYEKMQAQVGWPDPAECTDLCKLQAEDIRQVFASAREAIDGDVTCDTDLAEAYRLAMQGERESIDFYRAERDKATEPNARVFYGALIEAERVHLELLGKTDQYLNDTEAWYFEEEQWSVEG